MPGGSLLAALFLSFFLLIGLAILVYAARSCQQAKAAGAWPTARGEITERRLEVDDDVDGATYKTHVKYAYAVNGVRYVGDRIAFGYAGSSREDYHRGIHSTLLEKTALAVRYDPNDPSRSVLSHGVNNSIVFLMIFGAVWTLFTLGLGALFVISESGSDALVSNIIVYGAR